MHQMVSTIYYFFWVRYHPSKVYSQKESWQETKYRLHFPPTTKPHPLNPLDRGPTSLVLARYRLVVLRPFCACFTIFCFCLLSFPRCFYHSKLDLFRSAACFCLISSRVSCCVCHFLRFGFSFLHVISATDISCCSLFLFIVLLHISFHAYLFIQKDLGLCGPNNVDWVKKVLGPICLYLPKSFCQRTVFYGRSVFCCRFVICCRSMFCCRSAADLYSFFGPFLLFGLLGGPLGLDFYWAFFLISFWIWIRKNGHQHYVNHFFLPLFRKPLV